MNLKASNAKNWFSLTLVVVSCLAAISRRLRARGCLSNAGDAKLADHIPVARVLKWSSVHPVEEKGWYNLSWEELYPGKHK